MTTKRFGHSTLSFVERVPATTTSTSIDLATALPRIDAVTIDTTDIIRPTIAWTASGSLASTDGGEGFVFWERDAMAYRWSFVVPPGATSIQAPQFPAEAAAWLPFGDDASDPALMFLDSDLFADYAAFRRDSGLFSLFDSERIDSAMQVVLPKDGMLRATTYERLVR